MAVHGLILPAVFPTGTVITKVEQTHTSAEDGGENVITAEFFNGKKATFKVRNGSTGKGGRIEKVCATVDSAVGTPEVTVQEGGTPENKELTLSFKNLKGADGASLVGVTQTKQSKSDGGDNVIEFTLTDGSKSRVIIRNGSKGDKGDKPDGRMPLNPAAIYDFADTITRWKKEPIHSQSNIKSKPDHPRVLEPFTLENNKIFKITANITWTGDAYPRLIVTRNDWQKIVLDTTFSGVGSWRVIIPETDTYFVGIWMHGGGSFIPKPDDTVTIKSFVIHQLEQETVTDTSGNGGVGFVRGSIAMIPPLEKHLPHLKTAVFILRRTANIRHCGSVLGGHGRTRVGLR